ncbi:hypothetical protein Ccrd_012227 [Cynara cardunculus var. scolymus]|uniref:Uncharacterized protein n=2 Tax=Cynara cardunculus var. scolymus TaxID=59895 RepID=A0A103YHW7_CYNCS|nr:hypothetical protein Ccrd_012227 [Cynara cardunculus var. scolymus]
MFENFTIMADQSNSNLSSSTDDGDGDRQSRLKQAIDGGFISDDEGWSSESSDTSRRSLAASFRDFAESMMRREVADLEMMKVREAARIEAENRRLERENELMEMILKTQLEITSFLCSRTGDRKRRRSEIDDGDSPESILR